MSALAAIDTGGLFQVVWGSIAAVFALSIAFSLLLLGLIRSSEARSEQRTAVSVAFGLLAAAGLAAFAGGVAYGFFIIVQK